MQISRGSRGRAARSASKGASHWRLNSSEYVAAMRSSKAWLSTLGPADLLGSRYFEIFATGTTLCVANRQPAAAYASLGLVEGRHFVAFDTLAEFEEVVRNYTTLPEFEARRRRIVGRAQRLSLRKFTWAHVAARVDAALRMADEISRNNSRNLAASQMAAAEPATNGPTRNKTGIAVVSTEQDKTSSSRV